jgi:hypothetical protein
LRPTSLPHTGGRLRLIVAVLEEVLGMRQEEEQEHDQEHDQD